MSFKASKTTDPCDLERQILDPNIAKNEAEWWARERILDLEERLKLLEENAISDDITIDTLKEELRNIGEALDDPRVDLTITMVQKIKELQERRNKHEL
jgi:hypothetical protein